MIEREEVCHNETRRCLIDERTMNLNKDARCLSSRMQATFGWRLDVFVLDLVGARFHGKDVFEDQLLVDTPGRSFVAFKDGSKNRVMAR